MHVHHVHHSFRARVTVLSLQSSVSLTRNMNVIVAKELYYIYLTPVKTQLLHYNLARDLMLFYHSYKIKA